jgi:hypothetical protein
MHGLAADHAPSDPQAVRARCCLVFGAGAGRCHRAAHFGAGAVGPSEPAGAGSLAARAPQNDSGKGYFRTNGGGKYFPPDASLPGP